MRRELSLHKVVLFHTQVYGKDTGNFHPEKILIHIWLVIWNKSPRVTIKVSTSAFNLEYHEIFASIFWGLPFDLLPEKASDTESILWWPMKYSGFLFSLVFLCLSINVKELRCKRLVSVIHYSCWCAWAGWSYWGVLPGQWGHLPWHSFFHSLRKEVPGLELNVAAPAQQNGQELPQRVRVLPIARFCWTVVIPLNLFWFVSSLHNNDYEAGKGVY